MSQVLQNTTLEQRVPYYGDIETLISVGFLSHSVVVNEVPLSLRSLGPGDMFVLRTRLASAKGEDWISWVIASSIWMVDGVLILNEPHAILSTYQTVRRLPKVAKEILFSLVSGLLTRQNRAIDCTEAYCYESISRFKWKSLKGAPMHQHSGIPGQESLGTNHVQRMWTFYNEVEDIRIAEESAWEGFKMVASSQSPKGVKKIDEQDKLTWQKELARRQEVRDRFFYVTTGVLSKEDATPKKAAGAMSSKSVDDLEHEMYMWVSGQEDEHDRIVNAYKQKIIAKQEERRLERERRAAEFRQKLDNTPLNTQPTALVGYTQAQLVQILQHRQPGLPGLKTIHDETDHGEYLYTKYLERTPDSNGLVATPEGQLILKEKRDLTGQIAERQVPFETRREEE